MDAKAFFQSQTASRIEPDKLLEQQLSNSDSAQQALTPLYSAYLDQLNKLLSIDSLTDEKNVDDDVLPAALKEVDDNLTQLLAEIQSQPQSKRQTKEIADMDAVEEFGVETTSAQTVWRVPSFTSRDATTEELPEAVAPVEEPSSPLSAPAETTAIPPAADMLRQLQGRQHLQNLCNCFI